MFDADQATCESVCHKIDEKIILLTQKIKGLEMARQQLTAGKKSCQTEGGPLKNPNKTCSVFTV